MSSNNKKNIWFSYFSRAKLFRNWILIPGIGVEDTSWCPAGINIKNPLHMQLVHAYKEGVMSTSVTVIITVTDVLVSHAWLMFLLGKVREHRKRFTTYSQKPWLIGSISKVQTNQFEGHRYWNTTDRFCCFDALASQMQRKFSQLLSAEFHVSSCLDIKFLRWDKQAAVCRLVRENPGGLQVLHRQCSAPADSQLRHPSSRLSSSPSFQDGTTLAHTAWLGLHPAERERESTTLEFE